MFRFLAKLACMPFRCRRYKIRAQVFQDICLYRPAVPVSVPTQVASSSALAFSPWIPPELICLILANLWDAIQTPQERLAFVKNVALVNRTWLTLVAFITSRDVHIYNPRDANIFLRCLSRVSYIPGVNDLFTVERARIANDACRSITFHVNGRTSVEQPIPSLGRDGTRAISLILPTISVPGHLPNLQHISLRYIDMAFADAFRHLEQGSFPQQVPRLSVDYAFVKWNPGEQGIMRMLWMDARDKERRFAPLRVTRHGAVLPAPVSPIRNLRHLALSGVTAAFVMAILQVCPNIETLEITLEPSAVRLCAIVPLPPATRTVILCHPGTVSGERIRQWDLCHALELGLFSAHEMTLRIVLRSGTPDPVVFEETRSGCERFHVELVHEPDGS